MKRNVIVRLSTGMALLPRRKAKAAIAEDVLASPERLWLLLSLPYSRPAAVRPQLSAAAKDLERRGLLERDPTAKVAIWHCTEKGEEIAQAVLALLGAERV